MPTVNLILGLTLFFTGSVLVGLAVPLVRGRVPMNALYGVRFKKSFESEETWYAVNAYGGRLLAGWGGLFALAGLVGFFLPFEGRTALILGYAFLPLLILIPCWQTYRYLQRI